MHALEIIIRRTRHRRERRAGRLEKPRASERKESEGRTKDERQGATGGFDEYLVIGLDGGGFPAVTLKETESAVEETSDEHVVFV
jgi:hypothetical protein